VIAKAHDLGLMNAHVPETYGGPGLPCFEGMLIGEELLLGLLGHRDVHLGERPRLRPGDHRGQRRAEAHVAAAAARVADPLLVRS